MIRKGRLFRAELYDGHKPPYTNVRDVWAANRDRFPGKALIVSNGHWCDRGGAPCAWYKIGGEWLATTDAWNCLGLTWSGGDAPRWAWSNEPTDDNFICTIPVLVDGARLQWSIDSQTSGVRRNTLRTWWGWDSAGNCTIEVTTENYTLDAIVDRMASLGIVDGLVLDGSGSSQCYDGETRQYGDNRTIYEYLLLWFDVDPSSVADATPSPAGKALDEEKASLGGSSREAGDEGKSPGKENTMKTICIDPGHGGSDACNGAPDGSYKEHEFTLDLALRIKPLLEARGVEVLLTRTSAAENVYLNKRADAANAWGADGFVSLHSNAAGKASCDASGWSATARGLVVYTCGAGAALARNRLAEALIDRFEAAGVTMYPTPLCHAGFTVLTKTSMPACLVEYGFHTNRADVASLKRPEYRQTLALATAKGVCDWLGVAWEEQPGDSSQAQNDSKKEESKTVEERVTAIEAWARGHGAAL